MKSLYDYVKTFVKTLDGRPIALLGLGISNLAAAKALQNAGANIMAWDDNEEARARAVQSGILSDAIVELTHTNIGLCEILILSPGIPLYSPHIPKAVQAAQDAGCEIICDIELFHRLGHGRKTVGITGTNGKSTTAALLHHILRETGKDSVLGGNIGQPVFDLDMPGQDGAFIYELSSFQLDLCPTYAPDIAVLLNITPDHLDRHGTMERYVEAKAQILKGQGLAIIGQDDQYCSALSKNDSRDIIKIFGDKALPFAQPVHLPGRHNRQNIWSVWEVAKTLGITQDEFEKALGSFPGLPHRQFLVRKIGNVSYINDSKGTNVESTAQALDAHPNIYWILGGRETEEGLNGLEAHLGNVRAAFIIGEAAERDKPNQYGALPFSEWFEKQGLQEALNTERLSQGEGNISAPEGLHYVKSNSLEQAISDVQAMLEINPAKEPVTVLLSPACKSFDQYKNFEERGDHFVKLVKTLQN